MASIVRYEIPHLNSEMWDSWHTCQEERYRRERGLNDNLSINLEKLAEFSLRRYKFYGSRFRDWTERLRKIKPPRYISVS